MSASCRTLLDRQAIRDVVLRYCRGIDRLDLELVRDCYHPDATDEHGTFVGTRDEYVDWVGGVLARFTGTMHVVANQLVEVDGDAGALARPTAWRTTGAIRPTTTAATSPPGSATSTASSGATASGASRRRVAVREWTQVVTARAAVVVIPPERDGRRGRRDRSDAVYDDERLRRSDRVRPS